MTADPNCLRCPLARTRTHVVAPRGSLADARIVLVGEGPGANEDAEGVAFVGRSGRLLDEALRDLGLDSSEAFITNTVRCRPPGNRDPEWFERKACWPWLAGEFTVAAAAGLPIVALGKVAHTQLAERRVEHVHVWHPAYVLRDKKRYEEWLTQFPTFD